MKKLIRNIALFCLPLLLLLMVVPVDKRMQYLGLKDDCFNHGIWIHDRIYHNPKPVDIAFLGSSHAINGFNDEFLSDSLEPLEAVNFGYCRLGRNLHYVLLKEILHKKKLKTLVLEVREEEDRYSHPVFPFLAKSRDAMLPNPFFNRDILIDMWNHLSYKVEIYQDMLYNQTEQPPYRLEDHGYAYHTDTASSVFLDRIMVDRKQRSVRSPGLEMRFHNNFAHVYLKKIARLCEARHIELYFLYFPSYGSAYELPLSIDTYEEYGKVLVPPKEIFADKNHWYDENHLNKAGATRLSAWLLGELRKP